MWRTHSCAPRRHSPETSVQVLGNKEAGRTEVFAARDVPGTLGRGPNGPAVYGFRIPNRQPGRFRQPSCNFVRVVFTNAHGTSIEHRIEQDAKAVDSWLLRNRSCQIRNIPSVGADCVTP